MKRQLLVLFLLPLLMVACGDRKQPVAKAPVTVSVCVASSGDANGAAEYVGTITERMGTSLSFEVPGRIERLLVDNGDHVAKGQAIATIDPTSLRDAHDMALATLRQAQDAYRRFEPLHRQGVISDIQWVEVQTKLDQAKSAETLSRTQMSRTTLYAPFAGVIANRSAERGMNVMAGQAICRVVDIAGVDVLVSVPEGEVSHVAVGGRARVTVAAVGGRSYTAVVKEKGVTANAVSHTYDVKLAISGADGRLMPGMVCSVVMQGAQGEVATSPGVISVPVDAVKLDSDNRRFVWLVLGGKARRQYVTVGDFTNRGVCITSGVRQGDLVVTEGSQKISEGMRVRY